MLIQWLPAVRKAATVSFATIVAANAGVALRAQQPPPGHLDRAPYVVKTFDGREYQAELGRLAVRENRVGGRSNTLEIAFIRLPSRASKPGPPIVFLMGGPGIPASVMGRVPPYATLFDGLRDSAAEDLRRALAVERISVLAFSYGTHVALSAMRRHPESLSRVALAGTRGPHQSLKLPSTFDFVFRRLATLARGEAVARRQMPNLVAVLRSQLERLEHAPIQVTVLDRRQKRQVTLAIGKDAFQIIVTNAIDAPRLPALLYATSLGDDSLLTNVVEDLYNGLGETNLMARSIDCASGASEERLARVRKEAAWALLGDPSDNLVRSPDFCRLFERIDLGEDFRRPIWSDRQTLFMSGTLDAKAPVFEAEEIRAGFPNSAHLIVENAFHETLTNPELQRVIADFFEGGDAASQHLVAPPPRFLTIEQAKTAKPPGR